MKRGQIEIVGLMMVVILIAMILLFALWFIAKPKPDILTPQRVGIEVKSVLLTLMKTTYNPGIGDEDFKDKIITCAQDDDCESSGVRGEIERVLNSVFENKEYVLVIKRDSYPVIKIPSSGRDLDDPCSPQNNVINPGSVILQTTPPKIDATLVLCSLTV